MAMECGALSRGHSWLSPPLAQPRAFGFCSTVRFLQPAARLEEALVKAPHSGKRQCWRTSRRRIVTQASVSTETSTSERLQKNLEGVVVFDPNGASVALESLWKDRTVVVGFARHFGCVLCRKRADLLASKKAELDAAGVGLILIGPGSPDQAKTFLEQTKFPGEVYADPSHATFDAFQFVHGVFSTFTPKSGLAIIAAYAEGYRQDWKLSSEKNTVDKGGWQNGGVVVIGPGTGRLLFLHRDNEAGDEPNLNDVMKACCCAS